LDTDITTHLLHTALLVRTDEQHVPFPTPKHLAVLMNRSKLIDCANSFEIVTKSSLSSSAAVGAALIS
ncbi:hypothetical protein, partial [Bradyrhizobium japonicum]|uniref:hypothetical protein n=1 Tax=Bradyrhizobium japonicum TaxID=375 RepID=UPI001E65E174